MIWYGMVWCGMVCATSICSHHNKVILGLGTNYDVGSCIQQYFLSSPGMNSAKKSNKIFKYSFFAMFCFNFFAITADGKLSIQLPTSYFVPKSQL